MNKDLFPNSQTAEILRQMQEERRRGISLPNEEVLRRKFQEFSQSGLKFLKYLAIDLKVYIY